MLKQQPIISLKLVVTRKWVDDWFRFISTVSSGRMSWTVASQPRPLVCSSEEEGDWSTGICSCCNDMKQCMNTFVIIYTHTHTQNSLNYLSLVNILNSVNWVDIFRILPNLTPVSGYPGSDPEGCWVFWCCPCFACKTSKAFGQCLCLPLLDVCSCVHPATMVMRTNVRYHYGIKVRLFSRLWLVHISIIND